ncbi:Chemotaxis response regulator protein-glutamate methylesterase [wastewater metagenome]|uniref:Chemotaxis response regulator protein-glutamate methylesterase n=2 Tax=unclassified sequences TaxID=12908 RepID=A0A5B8RBH3_9ZZZZ|nr:MULTISPECIES: response regulator [Arhodomonas]MCS4504315.1 response regulator [Arhodomonas aquaeolei]QEA04804.1 chemotaxis response regulator protein-glutamate methylesterase [uncultured organism]
MTAQIRTALVVDDSRLARVALTKLLRRRDITADEAATGAEAVAQVRERVPDVIFMDYMMPDMDGFEATRQLQAHPGAAAVPVVMYTSQDSEDDRARAEALGVVDFLIKPSGEDGLDRALAAAREALEGAPAAEPAEAATVEAAGPMADLEDNTLDVPDFGEAAAAPAEPEDSAVDFGGIAIDEGEHGPGPDTGMGSEAAPPAASPAPVDEAALREAAAAEAERAARAVIAERLGDDLESTIREAVEPALAPINERLDAAAAERAELRESVDLEALSARLVEQVRPRVVEAIGPEAAERIVEDAVPSLERQLADRLGSDEWLSRLVPEVVERAMPALQDRLLEGLQDPLRRALSDSVESAAHQAAVEAADARAAAQAQAADTLVGERVAREAAALRRLVYTVAGVGVVGLAAVAALTLL